ncbi:MAG TPA: AraC family transcriptional regulator, partial [Saprospiraceae bacterium]|nr:AraC family transcriptional regulator [Saprospiraceae bacterium]
MCFCHKIVHVFLMSANKSHDTNLIPSFVIQERPHKPFYHEVDSQFLRGNIVVWQIATDVCIFYLRLKVYKTDIYWISHSEEQLAVCQSNEHEFWVVQEDKLCLKTSNGLCYSPASYEMGVRLKYGSTLQALIIASSQMGKLGLPDVPLFRIPPSWMIKEFDGFSELRASLQTSLLETLQAAQRISRLYYEILIWIHDSFYRPIHPQQRLQVEKIASLIVADFAHFPSLTQLSREFGTNKMKMNQLFRKHYGKTIYQYYIDAKIDSICDLLKYSGLTIKEIAIKNGY